MGSLHVKLGRVPNVHVSVEVSIKLVSYELVGSTSEGCLAEFPCPDGIHTATNFLYFFEPMTVSFSTVAWNLSSIHFP